MREINTANKAILLPCPFCGNDKTLALRTYDQGKTFYVSCPKDNNGCGATGGSNDSTLNAINLFNTRVQNDYAAHKHAHLMALYAQDAMETDKPWERWESRHPRLTEFSKMVCNPAWAEHIYYRRKKNTININGIEVSEPERKPLELKQMYYIPDFIEQDALYKGYRWSNHATDNYLLLIGLIHLDKESAILHAKALISFTQS